MVAGGRRKAFQAKRTAPAKSWRCEETWYVPGCCPGRGLRTALVLTVRDEVIMKSERGFCRLLQPFDRAILYLSTLNNQTLDSYHACVIFLRIHF